MGGLELFLTLGVEIDHPGRHALVINAHFTDPAVCPDLDPSPDGQGPIGNVGAGLGSLGAAIEAVAQIDAGDS